MGLSIHIVGVKEPTPEYRRKLEAYRACEAAGVDVPDELVDYFGGEPVYAEFLPKNGVEVDLDYTGDPMYNDGALVDLSGLPEGVTRIRVYASS